MIRLQPPSISLEMTLPLGYSENSPAIRTWTEAIALAIARRCPSSGAISATEIFGMTEAGLGLGNQHKRPCLSVHGLCILIHRPSAINKKMKRVFRPQSPARRGSPARVG